MARQLCWKIPGATNASLHYRDNETDRWLHYKQHPLAQPDSPHYSDGMPTFGKLLRSGYEVVKYTDGECVPI